MHLSTPPQPRYRPATSSTSGNATPTTPTATARRRLAVTGSAYRDRGTPVGKLLAMEGVTASPRRVRTRTWQQKAADWPSNLVMSIETSLQLMSLDPAGYPLAVALNLIHFLTRLPVFAAALPTWMRLGSSGRRSRYLAQAKDLADADQRLEALRRQAQGSRLSWGWFATAVSIALVLISIGNAVYLFSRRRKYTLVLRKDPLASPNARLTTLDFSSPPEKLSLLAQLKRAAARKLGLAQKEDEPQSFQVQELDVWTPDYVVWSLRLFTLYPPPLALMYHFLTPSSFIPSALIGSLVLLQTYALVTSYSHLVSDRATLQAEVMHEYDAKFVKPRLFVQKRDAATSTSELEYSVWRAVEAEQEEAALARQASGASARKVARRRETLAGSADVGLPSGQYEAQERLLDQDQMDAIVSSGKRSRKSLAHGSGCARQLQ